MATRDVNDLSTLEAHHVPGKEARIALQVLSVVERHALATAERLLLPLPCALVTQPLGAVDDAVKRIPTELQLLRRSALPGQVVAGGRVVAYSSDWRV